VVTFLVSGNSWHNLDTSSQSTSIDMTSDANLTVPPATWNWRMLSLMQTISGGIVSHRQASSGFLPPARCILNTSLTQRTGKQLFRFAFNKLEAVSFQVCHVTELNSLAVTHPGIYSSAPSLARKAGWVDKHPAQLVKGLGAAASLARVATVPRRKVQRDYIACFSVGTKDGPAV